MSLNKEKNSYIYIFAFILVVVVAGMLSIISSSLKPIQKANVSGEKMQNILKSLGLEELKYISREEAKDLFYKYIQERITIDYSGKILAKYSSTDIIDEKDKLDPFNIDLRKEYSKFVKPTINRLSGQPDVLKAELEKNSNIHLPLFICNREGKKYFVLAYSGKGLWDDVWGYIGMDGKFQKIIGAVFDHKGETPGLGSKITEDWFQNQFINKTFLDDKSNYTSFTVVKPGQTLNQHKVDGISGATFTGVGVQEMINRNTKVYYNFFRKNAEILSL